LKEKQSEIEALGRELRRKKQQFFEDRDSRKRDDIQYFFGISNQVVKKIAERAKINMVFQDVVYANPRIDITVKVIEVMDSMPTNK
jgi:outer membrane protein